MPTSPTAVGPQKVPSKKTRTRTAARQPDSRSAGFRRSDLARFRSEAVSAPVELASPAQLWERYAIPGGITVFWLVFVTSNWSALSGVVQQAMSFVIG